MGSLFFLFSKIFKVGGILDTPVKIDGYHDHQQVVTIASEIGQLLHS